MLAGGPTEPGARSTRQRDSGARWRARWRFLLATLVLATLYLALQGVWEWVAEKLMFRGWTWDDPAQTYAQNAADIAEQSKVREASLGANLRRATFDLGVQYGYLSEWRVSHRGLPPESFRASAERDLTGNWEQLSAAARVLGLNIPDLIPKQAVGDELDLEHVLDNDSDGVAHRVELATSPRLRHVYMLGVFAGVQLGRFEPRNELLLPAPAGLIGMHGTLGGVPASLWRPLTRVDQGNRTEALSRYRAAVGAIQVYFAAAH